MNYCSECKAGSAYFMSKDSEEKIDYAKCVEFSDKNCLVIKEDETHCTICKPGFMKNLDNICE